MCPVIGKAMPAVRKFQTRLPGNRVMLRLRRPYARWLQSSRMVQLVAHMTCNHDAAGSIPAFGSHNWFDLAREGPQFNHFLFFMNGNSLNINSIFPESFLVKWQLLFRHRDMPKSRVKVQVLSRLTGDHPRGCTVGIHSIF